MLNITCTQNNNTTPDLQLVTPTPKVKTSDTHEILNVDDDNVWPGAGEYDPMAEVVGKIGTWYVTRRHYESILPGVWIKDEVINFYYAYLQSNEIINQSCILTSSFFMTALLDEDNTGSYNFQNVNRWITNDLFKKEKFILPINLGNYHWATGAIFFREKINKIL